MTDFKSPALSPSGVSLRERLQAIRARVNAATDGPWAWESIAEKSNEFAVGLAWDKDGQPVRGEITDDPDAMQDTIIERRMIGMNESGHANFADADFIAHAREDIPYLLDHLTAHAEALESAPSAPQKPTAEAVRSASPHYSEWQPIETAPKDGTRLLLWNGISGDSRPEVPATTADPLVSSSLPQDQILKAVERLLNCDCLICATCQEELEAATGLKATEEFDWRPMRSPMVLTYSKEINEKIEAAESQIRTLQTALEKASDALFWGRATLADLTPESAQEKNLYCWCGKNTGDSEGHTRLCLIARKHFRQMGDAMSEISKAVACQP